MRQAFDALFKAKIRKATSRATRSELAREMLAAAAQFDGDMKMLTLTTAKDLAVRARDIETRLAIAGVKKATGISAHAPSRVVYRLGGKYRECSTALGMKTGAGGGARFHVIADGKTIYSSVAMWKRSRSAVTKPVVLKIVGVDTLELVAKGAGGSTAGSWSAWGDPKVR